MLQIVYTSKTNINKKELLSLIETSLANNKINQISSILLFSGKFFLQLLEGRDEEIYATYLKICNDNRNYENNLLIKREIAKLSFPDFTFEFRSCPQTTIESLIILCLSDPNEAIKKIDLMTNVLMDTEHKFNPDRLIFYKNITNIAFDNDSDFFKYSTEFAADEVFLMQDNSQIVYVNNSACNKLGYSKQELIGLHVWEWDPLFPKHIWPSFFKDFAQRKHVYFQTQHRKKTGEIFPVEIKAHLYQKNHKNYLLAFVNDISSQIKIEKELIEHKKNLEHIIKIRTDELEDIIQEIKLHKTLLDKHSGLSITSANGKIAYVNDLFCEITGYSKDEIIGKNHRIFKSGLHPKEFYKNMYETLWQGKIWKGEICNRNKNGSLYWVDVTIIPQLNDKNRPINFYSLRTNITDKKNSQILIAVNEEKLKTILNAATDGIHIIDENGNIVECSLCFATSLGYSKQEVLKLKLWEIDKKATKRRLLKAFKILSDEPITIQSSHKTKNGSYIDVEIMIKK